MLGQLPETQGRYRHAGALLDVGADGGDATGVAAGGMGGGGRSDGGATLADSREVDQASFTGGGDDGGVDGLTKENVS